MIEIFLVKEEKKNKDRTFCYLYFFDVTNSVVYSLNPYSRKFHHTENHYISELYYEDTHRLRIHKKLIVWEE